MFTEYGYDTLNRLISAETRTLRRYVSSITCSYGLRETSPCKAEEVQGVC
jgi:hypothetical protein